VEREFKDVLRIDPTNADAWNELGVLRAQQGDYRQAAEFWGKALDLEPGHHRAGINLKKLQGMAAE
jgi:Flp pilus assembly protein TadD